MRAEARSFLPRERGIIRPLSELTAGLPLWRQQMIKLASGDSIRLGRSTTSSYKLPTQGRLDCASSACDLHGKLGPISMWSVQLPYSEWVVSQLGVLHDQRNAWQVPRTWGVPALTVSPLWCIIPVSNQSMELFQLAPFSPGVLAGVLSCNFNWRYMNVQSHMFTQHLVVNKHVQNVQHSHHMRSTSASTSLHWTCFKSEILPKNTKLKDRNAIIVSGINSVVWHNKQQRMTEWL